MANINEEAYKNKQALPNKLLNEDGTITDLLGNEVINPVMEYENKPALPNKWLNSDGSYSTLTEIISGAIDTELFIVVEELPASGKTNKIYLLVDGDKLIEYHWTGSKWDPIGMVQFDVSKYSTTEQMNAAIAAALNSAKAYTDEQLTDYVKNTDYATNTKGGVIKVSLENGVAMGGSGNLIGNGFVYRDYQLAPAYAIIAKSTLENVITGKELVNKTYVDDIVGDIESILETLDVGGGVE